MTNPKAVINSYSKAVQLVVELVGLVDENGNKTTHTLRRQEDPLMLSEIIGDGNAKVTQSIEINDTAFGAGVKLMGSVSVTCNQDDGTIQVALQLAQAALLEEMKSALPEVQKLYESQARFKK